MKKSIPIRTAKAALSAMNVAANWIEIGEQGCGANRSWFTDVPSFDRRRKALRAAILKAEGK